MRWTITAALTIGLFAMVQPIAADKKTDREARKYFEEGVRAFDEARLGDALNAFKRAYALRPSYRILYNIGQAEAELKNPHRAIEAFEGYLADGGARILPERRLAVEKEVTRLRALVGELIVKGPRGAEVWLDGERSGYLPLAGPIVLPAGRHLMVVRQGRAEPCEQEIIVEGGTRTEESCFMLDHNRSLEEIAASSGDDPFAQSLSLDDLSLEDQYDENQNPFVDNVAPWLVTGLAAASLTSAIICAWRASDLNTSLGASCQDGVCPPDMRDDVKTLPRFAGAADGLFVTTAILSAAAITLFIAPWKDRDDESGDRE